MSETQVTPVRVLIVEDEPAIASLLQLALRHEGWQAQVAATGSAALQAVRQWQPDLIVLDIMLPEISGMAVLQQIRREGMMQPVLFLTALDTVDDKVRGLVAGGDDYVTKPFSVAEVVARLRSLLRRIRPQNAANATSVLQLADLVLDEDQLTARRGERQLELTVTEFELLRFLLQNTGRVLSKQQILDRVWAYDYAGKITVVELYISYLRKKVDGAGEPKLIHTVRGVGYVLREPQA